MTIQEDYKSLYEDLLKERDFYIALTSHQLNSLKEDLHNAKTELDDIKLYNSNIADELRKADSHNLTLAAKIQIYEDELIMERGRYDKLEEWLTEYRDQLKKENVYSWMTIYHKKEGWINAINELLNETSTDI